MDLTVRHFMSGRVRLHIPLLCRRRSLAQSTLTWILGHAGVKSARINYACACLIIERDCDIACENVLPALVGRLRVMRIGELRRLVGAVQDGDNMPSTPTPAGRQAETSPLPPSPMALPSLVLALAFSSNPIVRVLNLPLMLWNAYPIALRAWRVWRTQARLNVDFLDTLAVAASLAQGDPVAGAIVTWLVKLGDWIRDLTAAGSRRALLELLEFEVKSAWVVRGGTIVSVRAREVVVGDELVVYPGEMISVDGEIIEGRALIDQKTITGEGLPVSRGPGEAAFAGTVIQDGQIRIRTLCVGAKTVAGQIAELVESVPIGDTRMQNHAEKLADRLVVPTLGLATATALLSADFDRFLSLVIVDYGTGIRVAAPTAALSSMRHAAHSGIIIKSGRHMERLADVDTVVFDKTGTLTHGAPAVRDVITYQNRLTPERLLGLAAAAESRLKHPVADALRDKARQLRVNIPPCDEAKYHLGLGVEGHVNGYYLHVGNARFMHQKAIAVRAAASDQKALEQQGYSHLYIAIDGTFAGLVPYADKIRPESSSVIQRLRTLGIRNSVMLTGDNATVARAVGRRLGLTRCFSDMLPADKTDAIRCLQRDGNVVAMVGDGINDSPALSFADVGIAMRHGAEVAHESADVVLMEDSLWKLVKAVEISRDTVGLIRQNYAIVVGMNTLGLALALPGGLVSPSVTALISNGSAILASLNGLRPVFWHR